jgi:hypothetical protein
MPRLSYQRSAAVAAATLLAWSLAACGGGDAPKAVGVGSGGRKGTTTTAGVVGGGSESANAEREPGASSASTPNAERAQSTVTGSSPSATAGPAKADSFIPPAGRYVYDVKGYSQSAGSTSSGERRDLAGTATDDVTVTPKDAGTEVHTLTSFDDGRGQETFVDVDKAAGALRRLVIHSKTAGLDSEQNINPDPPIPIAKLPYRIGESWDSSWRDDVLGLQGVGTGETNREEVIDTAAGHFECVVIHVVQRIRGTFQGTLETTAWIARSSGVTARITQITDLQTASGSNHTETTRTLNKGP